MVQQLKSNPEEYLLYSTIGGIREFILDPGFSSDVYPERYRLFSMDQSNVPIKDAKSLFGGMLFSETKSIFSSVDELKLKAYSMGKKPLKIVALLSEWRFSNEERSYRRFSDENRTVISDENGTVISEIPL